MFGISRKRPAIDHPHIRFYSPRDLDRLIAIEAECFNNPWTREDFDRAFRCDGTTVTIAECCDVVVGYVIASVRSWKLGARRLLLQNIAIHPSYRRRGNARALVRATQTWANYGGAIVARVGEENLAAQLFFRDCGFRAVGIDHSFFCDGQDAYRFRWKGAKGVA
jgi:[ribosomal protein S18]-alanine N-acetyltransferase